MTEEVRFSGDLAFDVFSPQGKSFRFSQGFHEVTNRRPDALAEPVATAFVRATLRMQSI